MMSDDTPIPVVVFAYARPDLLRRTLSALEKDRVPLLHVFCDGARGGSDADAVQEVRRIARMIQWCSVRIVERERNLGLGASVRMGVEEVLQQSEMIIVFEDDIVCIEGTYEYLSAALRHYRDDRRVMSVTGWTHPRVRPPDVGEQPFFDGRFSTLAWGTWRRAWRGMGLSARQLTWLCRLSLRNPARYGADVVSMARQERIRNIWGARFCLLHILRKGLCLHPPTSLVTHIGYDTRATNASQEGIWRMDPPRACPRLPTSWPEPHEDVRAVALWQEACGRPVPLHLQTSAAMRRAGKRLIMRSSGMCNPERCHSVELRRAILRLLLQWENQHFDCALDYGCGSRPYQESIMRVAKRTAAADIGRNPLADMIVGIRDPLPVPEASCDLVTSFQVLEHVADYAFYLREIARVSKDGAVLLLSAPSVWPFHPHPKDYRRWTLDGLVHDLSLAGFVISQHIPVLNPISTSAQYFLSVCRCALVCRGRIGRLCLSLMSICLNALIILSEKTLGKTFRYGAGNFVVEARRVPRNVNVADETRKHETC